MLKPTAHDHPIHELLQNRWSPLAFADQPVSSADLHTLFEAVRWSPSSSNEQPWRFIVGTKDGDPETYGKLLDCIVPANQVWAANAPVLFLVLAATVTGSGRENRYALYDAGGAVANLTIQATQLGLHLHQMGGFDNAKARQTFALPDDIALGAMIALGCAGDPSLLVDEKYRDRHNNPTRVRKPLTDLVFSGAGETFGSPSPLL